MSASSTSSPPGEAPSSSPASSTTPSSASASASASSSSSSSSSTPLTLTSIAYRVLEVCVLTSIVLFAAYRSYTIRLYAIETYGRIIHEFDPWFNFRATQYLAENGLDKFWKWYDHMSWYPIGRPVGTTIYPGMQMTAVLIWNVLKWPIWKALFGFSVSMSLNDVCVFIPAWFGCAATITTGLLAIEVSGSYRAGSVAALLMAVLPAHLMRSIGGGYDNESVAMTAMCLSFYTWCRCLRTPNSWWLGGIAGLAYAYMVASWGGYIFVGNLIGLHAGVLVLLGYYSSSLHHAYTLWWLIGSSLAMQIPVVGWSPIRSLEQVGPLLVFLLLQGLYACDEIGRRRGLSWEVPAHRGQLWAIRFQAAKICGAVGVALFAVGMASGYFGSLSVRVRALFVKHTRTGNPLVDSVAEHQSASNEAYWQHLHYVLYLMPLGLCVNFFAGVIGADPKQRLVWGKPTHGVIVQKWFIIMYCIVAYYFANRMMRLLLLLAPVASVLGGVGVVAIAEWVLVQFEIAVKLITNEQIEDATTKRSSLTASSSGVDDPTDTDEPAASPSASPEPNSTSSSKKKSKGAKEETAAASSSTSSTASKSSVKRPKDLPRPVNPDVDHILHVYKLGMFLPHAKKAVRFYHNPKTRVARIVLALMIFLSTYSYTSEFMDFSEMFARQASYPSVKFLARLGNGREVLITDYFDTYVWLKENTPADARVLSWWDYGYQIAGISNRTTLADGNTWNLEHIALIGRILTAPEKKAHSLARHLADYVLVWAGNQGDDLAKSPHMARISSSVYDDICPTDALCRSFGFDISGRPTPSMERSMLYRMHSNGKEGVKVNPELFQEVHTSKYGLVRVYKILHVSKKSKKWLADPANRVCDAPGSWYCVGQYPPDMPDKPPSTHRHLDYDKLEGRRH